MYKMIAIDMDGTLLRDDKTISDETLRAIKLAKLKGVKVVLATGRPADGINQYLSKLDLTKEDDYVITFNGSLIQNCASKAVIFSEVLNINDFNYLHSLAKALNIDMHAFTKEHGLITPKMNPFTKFEATANKLEATILDFETLPEKTNLIKFMMVGEEIDIDRVHKILPKEVLEKYTVVKSGPIFLEFLNKQCNKGEAVKRLAHHLNISLNDVICIGDAGNDYHMIKYAGLGVAMGNAYDEVKEVADYVTKTNENHGVAHVINKFILAS